LGVPVNSTHPDYDANPAAWQRARDVMAGEDAVKRAGESAEAIALRQTGEDSILGNLSRNVGVFLTRILAWVYWWNSTEILPDDVTSEQVLAELNTDFSAVGLSAQDSLAAVSAWQNGALSRDSLLDLFRRGEVLPAVRTNAEETALIEAGKPARQAALDQTK
jgi:hypothetical protein